MAIHRVTVLWTGFQGAPGYSNFFFTGDGSGGAAADSRTRVSDFFNELATLLPSDVEYVTEGEVATLDEQTGSVTGYIMVNPDPSPGSGGSGGGYSAASGAVVTWNTNGVRNGRRVRGRTFLVPLGGGAYQSDGTLETSTIAQIQGAADELVGTGFDSGFGVWARPGASGDGGFYEVTGFRVPDMSAVLRSRRD